MKILFYPFMMMAAIGFVLSLATHLLALAGKAPPGGGLVWGLHIGIFAVWIPTVLISRRKGRGVERKLDWKTAVTGCPG
jgi:peptidoglycan biosynthesis protein MviN/MurJ (putative lipid II flippase)